MKVAAIFGSNRYLASFNRGIATPVCALARNDSYIFQTPICRPVLFVPKGLLNCQLSTVNGNLVLPGILDVGQVTFVGAAVLYPMGCTYYQTLRNEQRLQAELDAVNERNAQLEAENKALETDEGVESHAQWCDEYRPAAHALAGGPAAVHRMTAPLSDYVTIPSHAQWCNEYRPAVHALAGGPAAVHALSAATGRRDGQI